MAATMVAMKISMNVKQTMKEMKEMTMTTIMILTKTPIIDKSRSYRKRPFLASQD